MKIGFAALLLLAPVYSVANVVGTDVQNFNTTSNGIDFVTVQSSETLEPGFLNVGLFVNYAKNTLPYFEDPPGTSVNYDDSLTMADINVGLGVARNFDVGVNFPFLLAQENKGRGSSVEYVGAGNTEIRLNAKYRLWGDQDGGAALVASTSLNRVQDSPFVGKGGGPVHNLEAAWDTSFRRVAFGLNVGYRFKNPGEKIAQVPIKPYRDQVNGSMALSYLIPGTQLKAIFELYGAQPARQVDVESDKLQTVGEWLFGFKYDVNRSTAVHIGSGSRWTEGTAAPDYRVYTGVNWSPGDIFNRKATAEDVQIAVSQGLPEPITADLANREPIVGESTFSAPEVLFGFDSDDVDPQASKDLLEPLVAHLKKTPVFKHLVIKGHTDNIGDEQYNIDLSQRRAKNVKKALVEVYGLDEKSISTVGNGEGQPIADNGNNQGRAKNRRVEFTISR